MGIRNWFKGKNKKEDYDFELKVEWTPIVGSPEIDFLFIRVSDEDLLGALEAWRW